ncbi:MAG: hypothetical protein VKJ85_01845 [Prochlorothrix sp.]|nr:hypothetical protein [Prochlorothrix sp.]
MRRGISLDRDRNRLYIILSGFFSDADAQVASAAIAQAIRSLRPDFDVVTDISQCRPATPQGTAEIEKIQEYAIAQGARRFVRVVSDRVLIQMQLDRAASKTGVDALYVTSLQEAKDLLNGENLE